ncbi:MAG: SprT-like domain-containing protein [Bacteroidetes bacterium]|nr:SprT-like domain-containing protein [Bacteroidota bacterium]
MNQTERNQAILRKYIPEAAVPMMAEWIVQFDFKLKIKRSRQSKYGDYRAPLPGTNHQITINHDLNPYAFLLTLVHEVAHLLTYERHGHRVKPHGEEWKTAFKDLMRPVIRLDVFPADVRAAIISYMQNPAATSCSDLQLMRTLRRHDDEQAKYIHLETLPFDAVFMYNGRRFRKGEKRRTRYLCIELDTRRKYLFSALADVEPEHREEMPPRVAAHSIPPPARPLHTSAVPETSAAPSLPPPAEERVPLAALPEGALFELNGIVHKKGTAVHIHLQCTVVVTGAVVRFSPAVLVRRIG